MWRRRPAGPTGSLRASEAEREPSPACCVSPRLPAGPQGAGGGRRGADRARRRDQRRIARLRSAQVDGRGDHRRACEGRRPRVAGGWSSPAPATGTASTVAFAAKQLDSRNRLLIGRGGCAGPLTCCRVPPRPGPAPTVRAHEKKHSSRPTCQRAAVLLTVRWKRALNAQVISAPAALDDAALDESALLLSQRRLLKVFA